ncbi:terpenoid cyclases/Protein prenyltransferase [Testicularia cyperi]|uniref:Geranylgeranyl transferase type-2 subunit beta n=1 Tax=Testicularia cyperi TaxID=1882483 RepID=A0A317XVY8_9BASI|nr:terpenoid cyclases/Protein prenyltransferase [Testicularia cyperi]
MQPLSEASTSQLLVPLHVDFIEALDKKRDSLAYHLTTHLRTNGVYWGLTALHILRHAEKLDRQALIDYVFSCWNDHTGGFGSFPGHDAHVHSSLSAIQILAMKDALDELDQRGLRERLINFVLGLQLPSGAIQGDRWGETDTRFLYCAVSALAHLGALDRLDRARTIDHIMACQNSDGGFGTGEGAESHAAQVWVCVGALSILNALDRIDRDTVGWWLSERQLPNGGLNGRPQKLEDVCYSWWVLSSLSVIGRLHWINAEKLSRFILSAQHRPLNRNLPTTGPRGRRHCRSSGQCHGCVSHFVRLRRALTPWLSWIGSSGSHLLHAHERGQGARHRPALSVAALNLGQVCLSQNFAFLQNNHISVQYPTAAVMYV